MNWIPIAIQLVIALSIYNVWILRVNKPTSWRGGKAQNMKEEFATYGLPVWFMIFIGALKIIFATMLIAGIWLPELVRPAAVGMALLMLGAITMHFKVKDPLVKSLPSFTFLVLSLILVYVYY